MAMQAYRLPDGQEVVFDEWIHWPVFSTVEWASTSAVNLRAFTYVVGQRVPSVGLTARNADESDTNMVAKGRMNWDESFRVFSMTYETFGISDGRIAGSTISNIVAENPLFSALNLRRLQRDLMIELIVGADIEKPAVKAPFAYYHQGPGPWIFPSGDVLVSGVNYSHGTGGKPRYLNQRLFPFPVKIGNDRVMYLKVYAADNTVSGLDQDVKMRWYLDGVKRRPLG